MFNREDKFVGIVCVLLGIFVIIVSKTFKALTSLDTAGPGGLPTFLAWCILIIGIIHIVGAYLAPNSKEHNKTKYAMEFESFKPVLRISLVCALYIIVLEFIGYLIATPLLIAGIMWTINVRSVKSLLLTSVVTTVVLFLVFGIALKVRIPMGIFENFL